jgi:hypothetical protein
MRNFIEEYNDQWGNDPTRLLDEYDYHPKLTDELDKLDAEKLNREMLYKIILWKLSRFPYITDELVNELKGIKEIDPKEHRKAQDILRKLLRTRGIALPMASTILRFINPNAFQIIDDRAYRVLLTGEAKYPSKPQKTTDGYIDKSVEIYFKYLDRMHEVCSDKFPFDKADRILYQLDIKLGNKIGRRT